MKICVLKRPEIMLPSDEKDGNLEQALILLCRHHDRPANIFQSAKNHSK